MVTSDFMYSSNPLNLGVPPISKMDFVSEYRESNKFLRSCSEVNGSGLGKLDVCAKEPPPYEMIDWVSQVCATASLTVDCFIVSDCHDYASLLGSFVSSFAYRYA
jgi:hypothetical protein